MARRGRRLTTAMLSALALAATALGPVPAHDGSPGDYVPDDPLLDLQWGLEMHRVAEAWQVTTGGGTVVAVLDSGVDLDHPDLAANIAGGINFVGCEDDAAGCGNGDWLDGPDVVDEGSDHGTHVAGIIAASADDGIGIAGVAPDADLLSVRVLGVDGGSSRTAAAAITWAVDQGADVVNLSLGGLAPGLQWALEVYEDAIAYAIANDVLVVAAAGNSTLPMCGDPAFSVGVVCVAGVGETGATAIYSNFGLEPELNVVAAAGGDHWAATRSVSAHTCDDGVLSTVPVGTGSPYATATYNCTFPTDLAYGAKSGTSMASPHVAGVAALLRSVGCSAEQSAALMRSTAYQPVGDVRGAWTPTYGHGIVDAAAAVTAAADTCDGPVTGSPLTPAICTRDVIVDPAAGLPSGWSAGDVWTTETDQLGRTTFHADVTASTRTDSSLVSDVFSPGAGTSLRFAHRYAFTDTPANRAELDGGTLEVRVDDGPWRALSIDEFRAGGPSGSLVPADDPTWGTLASPAAGAAAWTESSGSYDAKSPLDALTLPQRQQVDLTPYAGQRIQLRWRVSLNDDAVASAPLLGPPLAWWIDEIALLRMPTPGC